jgi:hypothetical protein
MDQRSMALVNIIKENIAKKDIVIAEIGVYKGNNAAFMLKQLTKYGYKVTFYGFDLFENAVHYPKLQSTNPGIYDETIASGKLQEMSVKTVNKKLKKINPNIHLIKGDTKNTLPKNSDALKNCDVFYIDGGHDYTSVKADWLNICKVAKAGSIIIFDDTHVLGIKRLINEIAQTGVKIKSAFGRRKYFVLENK